ncbi:MAG: sporulation protein YqfC [Clostridiales bacterium]|jgi:sporulation protein YqfC|nr:sporulation protein YqfC [Clostridiales bacterium]
MAEKQKAKNSLLARASDFFDLPKEIALNLPLVTIIGASEVNIENYKKIAEYGPERVQINTSCGVFKIEGKKLVLKQITSEAIKITGILKNIGYIT